MGGEKISTTSWPRCWKGSPPRGRGKGGHFPGRVRPQGITPAWAGKSGAGYADKGRPGDHPRVGGEKRRLSECAQWAEGSPPRGRGKAACGALAGGVQRITPAWAGKSQSRPPAGGRGQDHPRAGGEKKLRIELSQPHAGSPPRWRGKVCGDKPRAVGGRITPAWAGKRYVCVGGMYHTRDHPRVGGEKIFHRVRCWRLPGSPPRGRGKATITLIAFTSVGITPAWAGKRDRSVRSHPGGQDHPRVGGEKRLRIASMIGDSGSPPHGRGKAKRQAGLLFPAGITPAQAGKRRGRRCSRPGCRDHPAWAGKSICLALPITAPRDHPRAGGEKLMGRPRRSVGAGSPPHERGKVQQHPAGQQWRGDHPRVGGEKLRFRAVPTRELGSPPRGRGKGE